MWWFAQPWPACGNIQQSLSDPTCVQEFNHEYKPMNYLCRYWHLYWLTLDWLWALKTTTLGLTFFILYMTLASNFLPGDSVKGGKKVSLGRRGNNLKETAADQIHCGPLRRLFRAIREFTSVSSAHLSKTVKAPKQYIQYRSLYCCIYQKCLMKKTKNKKKPRLKRPE